MKWTEDKLAAIGKTSLQLWSKSSASRENTARKILNISFLDGEQWIYYSKITGNFEDLPVTENVPKVTVNMMLPYLESVKSKIISMNIMPLVAPMTRDWSDYTLAITYQKMFQGIMNNIDFDDKVQDIIDVMLVTGGVYLVPYWNKEIDDIDVDILSDIMSYSDPLVKKAKDASYTCFFDIKSTSYINEKYNKNYKQDNLDNLLDGWYLKVFKELQNMSSRGSRSDYLGSAKGTTDIADINDASVVVKVFYKEDKKTKMALIGNPLGSPEVLETIDLECNMIYIPYYRNFFNKQGRTPLDQLRGVQRDINQMMTRLKADYSKREKILLEDDAIEISGDPSTFDFSGDEIVRFTSTRPGAAPIKWDPSNPKAFDFNILLRMWGEAGGQSEASRGNVPTSQASGLLTEMLIDQDETKIGNAKTNLRIGLKFLFKEWFKLINKHYNKDRAVVIMGRERGWQTISYDLFHEKRDNLNFDIRVQVGEALPSSQAARINRVVQLAQFGFYNDKPNPYKTLRELAGLEGYEMDVIDQHEDKQYAEIEMIINYKEGEEMPGVARWDDHYKHLRVLTAFVNTKDFDNLDRKAKQLILSHMMQHQDIIQAMVPPAPQGQQPAQAQQAQQEKGRGPNAPKMQGEGTQPKGGRPPKQNPF